MANPSEPANKATATQVDALLKESFEMIPVVFAGDAAMQLKLQSSIPAITAFTCKMWQALGARNAVDFVTLNANMGNAFVTSSPKTALDRKTMADFHNHLRTWTQNALGVEFTEEDLDARLALDALSQAISKLASTKLSALRQS